jgi:mannose-6-phosphate isomerase-like protein (cupin superfamily)
MPSPTLGQEVMAGKLPTTFEVLASQVAGAYSLVRQTIPSGVLMLPHTHEQEDQVAVVLSGRLGVLVGDREWEIGPGEIAVRPRGLVHSVWNTTAEDTQILEITSPGNFEHYFVALGELTARQALAQAPALAGEWRITQDPERAAALGKKYGVSL